MAAVPPTSGTVTGTITDSSTGTPLVGVLVTVEGVTALTTTGGSYTINGMPAGLHPITATFDGYVNYSDSVTVTAGATVTRNIQLAAVPPTSGTVTGTITDLSTGTPLVGVQVTVEGVTGLTVAGGVYTLNGVPTGIHSLTATFAGYENYSNTIAVAAGATVTHDIQMTAVLPGAGSVSGRIYRADGTSPCSGVMVSVDGLSAFTDGDGRYTINGINPGTQVFIATHSRYAFHSDTVDVSAGETTTYNAAMKSTPAVSCGLDYTIALREDGAVWAWGQDGSGELGDNDNTNKPTPVRTRNSDDSGDLSGITIVSGGGNHSAAMGIDGAVRTWGDNIFGQLGDGTNTQSRLPVDIGFDLKD